MVAPLVFSCINHAVDQELAAIRNHTGVYGNGMIGSGDGASTGEGSPFGRTDSAGTVGCSLIRPS